MILDSLRRAAPPATGIRPDGAARRLVDAVAATLALVLLAPLFVLVALAIRLTSPGPALYMQERVGRDGRRFRMLKFRTMVTEADRCGALVSGRGDERVTAVGAVLRKAGLDELPQLVNVARGTMTLIGPRPEVARYVEHYTAAERALLQVRPGLTGPGQIYFTRVQARELDTVADPEEHYLAHQLHPKLAVDLDYLRHRSLRRDLAVVLSTLAVLSGH